MPFNDTIYFDSLRLGSYGPALKRGVFPWLLFAANGGRCLVRWLRRGNFSGQDRNNAKSGANHAVWSRRVGMLLWCVPPPAKPAAL